MKLKGNIITVILLLLTVSNSVQAQMNQIWSQNYQQTATAGYSNESRKIAVDSDGNIYVLADVTTEFNPLGGVSANPEHYTLLLKYDSNGNFIASRQAYVLSHLISGFDNLGAFGLEIDADDNVYIGFNVFDPSSNFNVAMTKYNSNLVRLWTYTFNPSGIDLGVDMKVTPNGTVYSLIKSLSGGTQYKIIAADTTAITGSAVHYSFQNTTEVVKSIVVNQLDEIFATGSQLAGGFTSIMTASVSPSGLLKWKRIFNGGSSNRNDIGNQIVRGPNQELYVVGTSDRGAPFGNDPIVLKYFSGNGRLAWNTFMDADSIDNKGILISTVTPTNLFVASVSGNQILMDRLETNRGNLTGRHIYEPIPNTSYNVIDSVSVSDIQASPFDNIYLTGNVYAKDLNNQNFHAYYLARIIPKTGRGPLNQAFELNDEVTVEGSFNKSYNSVDLALNFTTGKLYSLLQSYSTFNTHDSEIIQIVGYDLPVQFRQAGINDANQNSFSIYPNPAQNILNILSHSDLLSTIQIVDITGKAVWFEEFNYDTVNENSNLKSVSIENIETGTYFLITTSQSGSKSMQKFVKL